MGNAQAQKPNYDIRQGPLAQTYGLFVPSTINTGALISADRITNKSLRNEWFYTSNTPFATKRNGKLLLGMGGNAAFNVIFGTDTEVVCQELIDSGYVHLNPAKRNHVLMLEKAGDVVFVDPEEMALEGSKVEYRSFPIISDQYSKDCTVARMPWVSAGYGSGYMLEEVMDNLRVNGHISETLVFTMNPDHAAENVEDDEIVARASWLGGFGFSSDFYAVIHHVDYLNGLRGVLLDKSAKGGAQKTPLETLVGKSSV